MKTNLIYGLRDPRNDVYYYIGKSTVGNDRPLTHLIKSHNLTVNDWVNQLESLGLVPAIDVIERDIPLENLAEREKFWIKHYYEINPELFNIQSVHETINKVRTDEDDAKFNDLLKLVLDIGNILKNERVSRNLTQTELSEITKLSRSTISLCESGENVTVQAVKKYLIAIKGADILTRRLTTRVHKKRP
jgi:DNA-binding XRE family transcriptional regulator